MSKLREPSESCPYFDSAISEIERARETNAALRDWGNAWKDECEEVQRTADNLADENSDLQKKIEELESVVAKLEREANAETTL